MIVLPGNHELYSDRKWRELTGNGRSASFVLGKNLILMPDTYGGITEPSYEGNGKNDNPYTPVDMDFINQAMKNHPDCDAVYLISHHFQLSRESEGFREFLKTEKRIVGLLSGHTHGSAVKDLGEEFSGLTLAQTGSFVAAGAQDAAHFNWGFRELLIRADGTAESRYIVPANEFYAEGQRHTSAYKLNDGVTYPTR